MGHDLCVCFVFLIFNYILLCFICLIFWNYFFLLRAWLLQTHWSFDYVLNIIVFFSCILMYFVVVLWLWYGNKVDWVELSWLSWVDYSQLQRVWNFHFRKMSELNWKLTSVGHIQITALSLPQTVRDFRTSEEPRRR